MLNESEKNQVKNMIAKGKGYKEAADTLMLSRRDTQEYLQELITEGWRPRDEAMPKYITSEQFACEWCGKLEWQNENGRPKRFCGENCRHAYTRLYSKGQIKKCEYCAKEYEARNSNQQFCGHDCYIKNRFWKKEEANQAINALMDGEDVVIPKWLKEKLLDAISEEK